MELRPLERRVMKLIANGEDHIDIADKFNRGRQWVVLVERMATYKQRAAVVELADTPDSSPGSSE